MIISIVFILVGFLFLVKGADFLIEGASNIAKRIKISEIIIGLTIVAIGTSLPELVVTINGARQGYSDLSVGNIIGSCILNLLLVLGITSMIKPIKMKENNKTSNLIFLLLSIITVWIFGNINGQIGRGEGILLLLIFFLFLFNLDYSKEVQVEKENKSLIISIILLIIGIIGLKFGGDFVVSNSINIARIYGISERIIGLTIISIGTSLPELITSIVASRKGNEDIALGNIIGSNIFNLLLVLGISAQINPINFSIEYNSYFLFLFAVTLLLILFDYIDEKNKITRKNGSILVALFLAYMARIFYIQ